MNVRVVLFLILACIHICWAASLEKNRPVVVSVDEEVQIDSGIKPEKNREEYVSPAKSGQQLLPSEKQGFCDNFEIQFSKGGEISLNCILNFTFTCGDISEAYAISFSDSIPFDISVLLQIGRLRAFISIGRYIRTCINQISSCSSLLDQQCIGAILRSCAPPGSQLL